MARANRHYIQDYVWHITHRCHKKEFLLRFLKDRKRWKHRLFEAKKRYGLRILNYTVTSNHIHLLVIDSGREGIPKSIQLVAGRTAQEYNQRKNRKGAFWEDRYHATAIATDQHLQNQPTFFHPVFLPGKTIKACHSTKVCRHKSVPWHTFHNSFIHSPCTENSK